MKRSLPPQEARPAPRPARLGATPLLFGLGVLVLLVGLWRVDANPARIWEGLSRLGWLFALMWPPSPGGVLPELLHGLAESMAMAFLGTLIAALVALPLALLGAGNIVGSAMLRFSVRRLYDGLRGIDTLIWALIFVSAVGMGPFAGILALAVPDVGTLAKLFSEALEGADRRQVEGVRAGGSGRLLAVRFGLLPQVAPLMLSQVLYTLESNARSSTVLGIVGAGGIGLALSDRIRINNWDEAAFIVLMILVMVAAIDLFSRAVRLRVIRA
ncbi:phosphonate ABC transporter, permease protein PhnE [Roseomonas alkaliterrae]|uniref:Phosphonate transport system permease protein n=1 Tax=Neoroseomonas alkaliterrae TaxID=1452450 RepID=A0A840Y316_9PROT|nr:phosphonate ABC transporter, permease protein PhnE [Neoroseomonas alkaliterrae]MBB5690767.1 phosphonate transport system permease protein [Neoroseomonas alkaliterrae]MBR0677759.1 phosphonate ABC transporter, permease protein PhnE [Neoroseomonas alkaliterrae]